MSLASIQNMIFYYTYYNIIIIFRVHLEKNAFFFKSATLY